MGDYTDAPEVEYANSYVMGPPAEGTKFAPSKVTAFVKPYLQEKMDAIDGAYDHAAAKDLALEMSKEIKERCKELGYTRYKLACQVVIGQVSGQGMHVASRCLWDADADNCASVSYNNVTVWCTALVFGCYYE